MSATSKTFRDSDRSTEVEEISIRNNALHVAKQEITAAQNALSRAMFRMFETVHRLRQQHFEVFTDIEAWLTTECGISDEDIATYENFETVLGSHKELLSEKSVAFDTIKALVRADNETRDNVIGLLRAGNHVSPGTVRSVAKIHELGQMSSAERRAREQRLFFRRKSHEQGQAIVSALQREARKLYGILLESGSHLKSFEDEPSEFDIAVAKVVREDMASRARKLLTLLNTLEILPSTSVENWLEVGLNNPTEQNMSEAKHALELLVDVPWIQPGMQVYVSKEYPWAVEDGIFHLTGLSPRVPRRSGSASPGERLISLEICAGIGGEAIGLMAAGFKSSALFDNNKQAVATMKANWSDWKPVLRSIATKIGEREILQHRGTLDLLAGGVPCQPFSRGGKKRGEFDKRQQFDAAAFYVRELQPRAFAFENVVGFADPKHTDFRRRFESDFASLGYDVKLIEMNTADYGLAQDRKRVVLVGLKQGYVRKFRPPALVNPIRRGFGDTIADVLFPYRSAGNGKLTARQMEYDEWAAKWLFFHKNDRAPTLTHVRTHSALDQTWRDKGFIPELRSAPFGLDDFGGLPYLTPAILKRLQGLPDEWVISDETDLSKVMRPIANVFPPVLARAVGLSIREALTGQFQDLDRAMAEPIIDSSLIGHRRDIFDFQSSWARFTKPLTPSVTAQRWRRDILLELEEQEDAGFIGEIE